MWMSQLDVFGEKLAVSQFEGICLRNCTGGFTQEVLSGVNVRSRGSCWIQYCKSRQSWHFDIIQMYDFITGKNSWCTVDPKRTCNYQDGFYFSFENVKPIYSEHGEEVRH